MKIYVALLCRIYKYLPYKGGREGYKLQTTKNSEYWGPGGQYPSSKISEIETKIPGGLNW